MLMKLKFLEYCSICSYNSLVFLPTVHHSSLHSDDRLFLHNLLQQLSALLHTLELFKHVWTVVSRLAHALVEVIKRWMWHLQSLIWNSSDTSEVGLITLILQNSLLTHFNLVFLLEFLDEGLHEFLLVLHFLNFGFDLICDSISHLTLMHGVATDLSEEFEKSHRSQEQSTLIEFLCECNFRLFTNNLSSISFPKEEYLLGIAVVTPLIDPIVDNVFITPSCGFHLASFELFLNIDLVQNAQFRTFLSLQFFDLQQTINRQD